QTKNKINWQATDSLLNYKNCSLSRYISIEKLKLKTFQIKLITNELLVVLRSSTKSKYYLSKVRERNRKQILDSLQSKYNNVKRSNKSSQKASSKDKEGKKIRVVGEEQIEEYAKKYIHQWRVN
ncbi:19625_t:CDS:1, partial [Gigaspora margarita]